MSIIVTVTTSSGGFTATAKRGPRDYDATATSPEMAVRIAAAGLLGLHLADVKAVRCAPNTWTATPRHGALLPEGAP